MGEKIGAFFSNESPFGQIMTRCGVVIAANIMFVLFSIPVIIIGPAYTALYYVLLKAVKNEWEINPFKEFWTGFKTNIKQGTIAGVIVTLLGIFLVMDIKICTSAQGFIGAFKIPVYVLSIVFAATALYLFPTIAAFENKLKKLVFNSIFFAIKNPLKMLIIIIINVVPMVISYIDTANQPLYAFIWSFFGFGLLAAIGATLLWPEFKPFISNENVSKSDADSQA